MADTQMFDCRAEHYHSNYDDEIDRLRARVTALENKPEQKALDMRVVELAQHIINKYCELLNR